MPDLDLSALSQLKPILIAGPTASGKSSLALKLATEQGRVVINADALQVFDGWHLLTARPSRTDLEQAPHLLYGHVSYTAYYSVGDWLRDLRELLQDHPAPVIVGGTGLYLSALTEGLAEIPATEPEIRRRATAHLAEAGLTIMVSELDPETRDKIDTQNPMRVQRAWEVLQQTGRGLANWQAQTTRPLIPADHAELLLLNAEKPWLNDRISRRFDQMMKDGAMDEARNMAPTWDPGRLSSKAIGAAELISVLHGTLSEEAAIEQAKLATRQYAKRQRTWFRRRMSGWQQLSAEHL